MSKEESPQILVLPYIYGDPERKKDFTPEMEVAAILCLAEANRKKPGIFSPSPEKVSFILKLHYPLWAIPWKNESLLVDGLGANSSELAYPKTPNISLFTEDLESSKVARNSFREALETNAEIFHNYNVAKVSMGLVFASKEFLMAITEYVAHDVFKVQTMQPILLAPPRLSKLGALEEAKKVVDHWNQIQNEIMGLQHAIGLLSNAIKYHEQKILKEIELIRDMYENEISQIKPIVERRVERLKVESDHKTNNVLVATEKKLNASIRSKDKLEEELRKLERHKSNSEERRKASKSRGDKAGGSYWNSSIESCRKKISETNKKIQALSQFIEKTRKQGEKSTKEIREKHQELIDAEKKRVTALEASRDQDIAKTQKERQDLQSNSSSIKDHISQLLNEKKIYASKINEMSIPLNLDKVGLICIPFYLLRYDGETKHKYRVFLPSVTTDNEGIVRWIQRAIWSFSLEAKIKLLLRPNSDALKVLAPAFTEMMKKDKTFEENVCKLGYENNLLRSPRLKDILTSGMEELQSEGWINQEEKYTVLNAFALNNR